MNKSQSLLNDLRKSRQELNLYLCDTPSNKIQEIEWYEDIRKIKLRIDTIKQLIKKIEKGGDFNDRDQVLYNNRQEPSR